MGHSRQVKIQALAGDGQLDALKELLGTSFTQFEIDIAMESAIIYSHIGVAEYLFSLGADFANDNYQGVYYAVHNNALEGLRFAISKGVDINVDNGMPIRTSIVTAINTKEIELVKWLIDNGADTHYLTENELFLIKKSGTPELKELIKNVRS